MALFFVYFKKVIYWYSKTALKLYDYFTQTLNQYNF